MIRKLQLLREAYSTILKKTRTIFFNILLIKIQSITSLMFILWSRIQFLHFLVAISSLFLWLFFLFFVLACPFYVLHVVHRIWELIEYILYTFIHVYCIIIVFPSYSTLSNFPLSPRTQTINSQVSLKS